MEKKPVYNGYKEEYLTGLQLKEKYEDSYYADGRHHSVVLGITIPDYLRFIGIEDSKVYRCFVNEFFCRIMDGENDKYIDFLSPTKLENVKLNYDPTEIETPFECPECGSPTIIKNGKYGKFISCSKYPDCKYSKTILKIGNYK